MNQNYNYGVQPVQPVTPTQPTDGKKIAFYILLAVAVVGCFLPYLTISGFGESVSMNYVYYEDKILDGVYVIAVIIAAFSTSLKKGFKSAIIFLGIALGIILFDFIDIQSEMESLTYGGLLDVSYGIGFYLLVVGTIGAFVLSIMLNKNAPVVAGTNVTVATNVYQPTQPVQPGQPNYGQQVPVQPAQTTPVAPVQPMVQPMAQPVPQAPVTCAYCGAPRNEGMFCKSCGGKY